MNLARLVRVSLDLEQWGARDVAGNRITAEWGEPDDEGVFEPIFSVHYDDNIVDAWRDFTEPIVEALHGLHSSIHIDECDVERCREWMRLRSAGAPSADDVRGLLAA